MGQGLQKGSASCSVSPCPSLALCQHLSWCGFLQITAVELLENKRKLNKQRCLLKFGSGPSPAGTHARLLVLVLTALEVTLTGLVHVQHAAVLMCLCLAPCPEPSLAPVGSRLNCSPAARLHVQCSVFCSVRPVKPLRPGTETLSSHHHGPRRDGESVYLGRGHEPTVQNLSTPACTCPYPTLHTNLFTPASI